MKDSLILSGDERGRILVVGKTYLVTYGEPYGDKTRFVASLVSYDSDRGCTPYNLYWSNGVLTVLKNVESFEATES